MRFWQSKNRGNQNNLSNPDDNGTKNQGNAGQQPARIRRRFRFYGRVQNVGFRYECYMRAKEGHLVGWVENKFDGSVLAEVEGEEMQIALFIQGLQSIPRIRIERLETENLPVLNEERSFSMRY